MFRFAYSTCVFVCASTALMAQTTPVAASIGTTGMIGIADGQTAQLNLLNPGIQPPALGVICTAHVMFMDGDGNVLKTGTLSVIPGKSMAFDLRSDTDLKLASGDRIEIRVVISIPAILPPATTSTPAMPACKLIPTLEIFDTTSGRTLVTLGHVEAVPPGPTAAP